MSLIIPSGKASAQVCSQPDKYIYGLTPEGNVHQIRTSNANVSPAMNPAYTGNVPSYANAIGYNNINGKFYYFKRNTFLADQEFVSFDPASMAITILASCPSGTSTIVNLGAVNNTGTGYYCVDAFGKLFYYDIPSNTWAVISSALVDQFGTNLSNMFYNHYYGDIVFDGSGNLWIICASDVEYGIYKINAPVPTTSTPGLVANQLIAPTRPTPNGRSVGGIAFNSTGQIYFSTNGPDNKLFLLENDLSFTFIGTLDINGTGNDLTSCNFPLATLAVSHGKFSVDIKSNHDILLSWEDPGDNTGYYIEHSNDGSHWENIGYINNSKGNNSNDKYSFTHHNQKTGRHYYRIRYASQDGSFSYSEMKLINLKDIFSADIGPVPARNILYVQLPYSKMKINAAIKILDLSGRILKRISLTESSTEIDISSLSPGAYLLHISASTGEIHNQKFYKQ